MSDEIRKQRLLRFLDSKELVWLDQDHPELVQGTEQWVRELRAEGDLLRASATFQRRGRVDTTL